MQVALQRQTCRSPAEPVTRDKGMGMLGQGAELRGLTMVSAQRWGQGRGSRGSPFNLQRDVNHRTPPTQPRPQVFPGSCQQAQAKDPGV